MEKGEGSMREKEEKMKEVRVHANGREDRNAEKKKEVSGLKHMDWGRSYEKRDKHPKVAKGKGKEREDDRKKCKKYEREQEYIEPGEEIMWDRIQWKKEKEGKFAESIGKKVRDEEWEEIGYNWDRLKELIWETAK
ncbi:hypothetical protein PV325_007337 [Microctonus aethiopoides]|nr:hypothetical protein PV325_007337 [Microctonus aethiopoides]